jgi:hypothetical protein
MIVIHSFRLHHFFVSYYSMLWWWWWFLAVVVVNKRSVVIKGLRKDSLNAFAALQWKQIIRRTDRLLFDAIRLELRPGIPTLGRLGRPDFAVGQIFALLQIQLQGLHIVQVDQFVGHNFLDLFCGGMDRQGLGTH